MKLTTQEIEILKRLSLSNKEIAKHLALSLSTTKRHIHNIFNKLSFVPQNRCAIMLYAIKEQIILLEDTITE